MKKQLTVFVLSLLCDTATCSYNQCDLYESANTFSGRYCPTEGIITPNLAWHQCKLFCLHSPNCQAVNYNFIDNLCIYFAATCPKAMGHPDMAFALFAGRPPEQCIEWIPKEMYGLVEDDRAITEDSMRFVARMQKGGNDFVCYTYGHLCMSKDSGGRFKNVEGYPCQYLRIREGCTVYYVNYELGAPLPPNVLVGGYTADGLPVYIGHKLGTALFGYYISMSKRLIAGYATVTDKNVGLLVSL